MELVKRNLKVLLESLYSQYNREEFIGSDPLIFAYDYPNPRDAELVAFIASSLAYGRVAQIQTSLKRLLELMGDSPYEYIKAFDLRKSRKLSGFRHRFNSGSDISDLFLLLKYCLKTKGSLENYFCQYYDSSQESVLVALTNFCESLLDCHAKMRGEVPSRGLKYLLVSPSGKSPCKRMNMFLRWVVRNDDVDLGLWKSIPPSKLIVPLDTHMIRLCRILGFHNSKTASLSTAQQVTNAFKEIAPDDPVKYDFALSRIGIIEGCNGTIGKMCEKCELLQICKTLCNH